jgi:hypothetical protein
MNDEELLAAVEAKVIFAMLQGCEMDDHLGRKVFDPGPWVVTLRADQMSRLIDLARRSHDPV